MAPKSRVKKKSSKGKGSGGANIAAGIMPLTAVVAVARKTPPPGPAQNTRELDLGLSQTTGVLSASLLGRMFRTISPGEIIQDNIEDTDTSLNDYETAQATATGAYSTVGAHRGEAGPSDRERQPTPTGSVRGAGALEDPPIYAQVNKVKRTPSRLSLPDDNIEGSSAMKRFNEEEESSFRRGGSRRGSRRSRRSRQSIEEQMEAQMVEKEYSALNSGNGSSGVYTMPRPVSQVSGRSTPYSHQASPRLATLRSQNAELIRRQRELEAELRMQQERQQRLVDRLLDRGKIDTNDEETHSLRPETDRTIRKTDELCASLQERIDVLEKEKKELTELNEQLQMEIYALRKKVSYREDDMDDEESTQGLMKKQLKSMMEENGTLKSAVHRLNVELSRYQAQFRPLKAHELRDAAGLPGRGGKPQWLIDTKYLSPLFLSYDDLIAEKDEAVHAYREELEMIKQDIEAVLKENKRLHLRLEQTDAIGGPCSMTEWRQLQEQCKLVLEENQLLMEQLDLHQHKSKDMHRAHMQEVVRLSKRVAEVEGEKAYFETQIETVKQKLLARLSKRVAEVEGEKAYFETQIETVRHKLRVAESKTTNVTIENLQDEITTIAELKRMLEEEKLRHKTELENNLTKIQMLSSAKKSLAIQVEDYQRENKELSGEVKALQKAQRKAQRKVLLFQAALEEAEVKAKSSEHYLKSVVRIAENTAKERDLLAQSAHDKDREKKIAVNKLIEGNVSKSKMQEKMELYKSRLSEKLEKASARMKEQDDDFNHQRQEFQREILHLRTLLQEREQMIETVILDKKNVEEDLETMWQVASRDNQEMERKLRESMRKLCGHEGLRAHVDRVFAEAEEDRRLSCTDDEALSPARA